MEKSDSGTQMLHLRFPSALVSAIDALAGTGERTAWIVDASMQRLRSVGIPDADRETFAGLDAADVVRARKFIAMLRDSADDRGSEEFRRAMDANLGWLDLSMRRLLERS